VKRKPPVQPGQVIEYTIDGLAHNGSGVGKYQGFTLFVPLAIPGEKVKVKVKEVKKTYAQTELVKVLQPHADRTQPLCPIYEQCGGCQLQHLSYEAQLQQKRQQVVAAFAKIGGLEQVVIHPVLGMEEPWRYRNKAQVPFAEWEGRVIAGFYAPQSHEVIEMESCFIQHPENDRAISTVKRLANQLHIPAYHEKTGQGILRHVLVRIGFHTHEMMILLVTNGEHLPQQKIFVERLRDQFPQCKSIVQNIQHQRTNVILGPSNRLLWGREVIYDTIGPIRFAISPHSFFQVNPVQTEVLYDQVRQYARLTGQETVIDAYCGIGTIALYLAQDAQQVYGVEVVPEAIQDAQYNARLNEIHHAHFAVGTAEKVMPQWLKQGIKPAVIIVDPPRKGCEVDLLNAVVKMVPDRLIYVSCNPATLARDAKYLSQQGYDIVEVQPVDMFPQTSHVECCSLLVRKDI
jgi:23S rRNA (uracil1939-C5)-methyltransferase